MDLRPFAQPRCLASERPLSSPPPRLQEVDIRWRAPARPRLARSGGPRWVIAFTVGENSVFYPEPPTMV